MHNIYTIQEFVKQNIHERLVFIKTKKKLHFNILIFKKITFSLLIFPGIYFYYNYIN